VADFTLPHIYAVDVACSLAPAALVPVLQSRPLLRGGLTRMSRSNDDVGAVPYRTEARCSAREEVCGQGVAARVRLGLGKHPTSQRASHTHMDEYPGVAKNEKDRFLFFSRRHRHFCIGEHILKLPSR